MMINNIVINFCFIHIKSGLHCGPIIVPEKVTNDWFHPAKLTTKEIRTSPNKRRSSFEGVVDSVS